MRDREAKCRWGDSVTEADLFVAPKATQPLSALEDRAYDALICSLGYETRSRATVERVGSDMEVHAAGFPHHHTPGYEINRHFLASVDAKCVEVDDEGFSLWAAEQLLEPRRRVAIDISSMSRPRIAAVVQALRRSSNKGVVVDFLYVPQRYTGAPQALDIPTALEPVSPDFAGWYANADSPLIVLFGLGFEPVRAAGAIDVLEPDMAIPFFPYGSEEEFIEAVQTANDTVLRLPTVETPRPYYISSPFACFAELDSLVSLYAESGSRPLLLPLGPKIFALICILVATMRNPTTPVWRVSPGPLDQPVDRMPSDMLVAMSVSPSPIELEI